MDGDKTLDSFLHVWFFTVIFQREGRAEYVPVHLFLGEATGYGNVFGKAVVTILQMCVCFHCCSLSLFLIIASPQLYLFFLFFTLETIWFFFPGDVQGHRFDSDNLQK